MAVAGARIIRIRADMADFDKALSASFQKIQQGARVAKIAMANAVNPQLGGTLVTVTNAAGRMNTAFQTLTRTQLNAAQAGAQHLTQLSNISGLAQRLSGFLQSAARSAVLVHGPLSGIGSRLIALSAILTAGTAAMVAFGVAIGAVALGLVALARFGLQTQMAFERIHNTLLAVTGSAQGAANAYQFVLETSRRLGVDLASSAQEFARLAAAAKGTALEGQAIRDVFTSVAEASTVMGLSAEQSGRILVALQQMISKGTVSAEELRQQMGDALPGAFQIAAKAMGVTTAEFNMMLQRGEVLASDFLPKFARELKTRFGDAANTTQSLQPRSTPKTGQSSTPENRPVRSRAPRR